MAYSGSVFRWNLYWADLNPFVGGEQGGESRSVIVVSNDGFNRTFEIVTVVPVTRLKGKKRKVFPFEVVLPAGEAGNEQDSIVMPYQIRTISKMRLLSHIGELTNVDLQREIEDRILDHIGIPLESDGGFF
jgi:mRNA interferase MazF